MKWVDLMFFIIKLAIINYNKILSLPQALAQKGHTISTDHKIHVRIGLYKINCQGEANTIESLERTLCASHQEKILFEVLAIANHDMIYLTTVLTTLRKYCAHKHQVESGYFSSNTHRLKGPELVNPTRLYLILSFIGILELSNE